MGTQYTSFKVRTQSMPGMIPVDPLPAKRVLANDNNSVIYIGIPFVIPKAHLDAICVPIIVSMSHLQMQQVMKRHLSISI
jgi:hypothetical protein